VQVHPFGFSDTASLDYQKEKKNSAYSRTQRRIRNSLSELFQAGGRQDLPAVLVAYSPGCHVISNYIWDAQQRTPKLGVWHHAAKKIIDEREQRFARLEGMRNLFTLGCNIPVFVAGYKDIQPFRKPHPDFAWVNINDRDEVIGYPLKPLSKAYEDMVEDVAINANQGLLELFTKSWNPLSHVKSTSETGK
jgi:hypothetical protein